MAGTRPKSITQEAGNPPIVLHNIDQFWWYRDIINRTLEHLEEQEEEALSAVRFLLPYVAGRDAPSYVIAIGNGFDICNAYIARVNWGMSSLTARRPKERSGLWRVFSYSEKGNVYGSTDRREQIRTIEEGLPMKLSSIFTTDISPFLKGGNYPLECDRVYDFGLSGFDKLKVIARNRQNRAEQELEIIWVPDSRRMPLQSMIKLLNCNWTAPDLVKSLPYTDQFTFSSDVNSDSL